MNTGENIRNAVLVLTKTYESVKKLMDHCKALAGEHGYSVSVDKFLRWKSDNNYHGWLLNSFILVFQKESDGECASGNEWKDGAVYTVEIFLGSEEEPDALPQLLVSQFEYNDINSWSKGCSPTEHWGFYQPVHREYADSFLFQDQDSSTTISTPKTQKISQAYWDLHRVITKRFPLIQVNAENVSEMVFGTFDKISEM